jgi:hypothetical protein
VVKARGNHGSSSFSFAAPVLSLGGRESALSLSLIYNSQLWQREVNDLSGAVSMNYNFGKGWPAPGWRLGWGRIIENYDDTATGNGSGSGVANKPGNQLLIEADGTRTHLEQYWDAAAGIYKFTSTDGRLLVYSSVSGKLKYPDGTLVTYNKENNRRLPVSIQTPNGNILTIAYRNYHVQDFPVRWAIDFIKDTLDRRIDFIYDTEDRLTQITAPAENGSGQQTLVDIQYQTLTLDYKFDPSYTINAPAPLTQTAVIRRIAFPQTGTGYLFDSDSNA